MKRTISAMVGQGSVNHNSRKFNAKNTDPERSHLNITYCQENIKAVFHEMFDEALKRYNDKQTRADRRIENYYEKIRSSKQEKPFHEIILQVGNKDDMSAGSEDGQLAAAVLDEYMRGFQERNPQLRVFSAHLHMDEATPHLHIDFVPFTTGSKRGLDTRVSLKQALAAQGFKGGTRGDTEWSQWVCFEYGLYYSPVSTPADFRSLAPIVLEQALKKSGTQLLEPYLSFTLYAPQEYLSRAYHDAPKYCATIETAQVKKDEVVFTGEIPARCIQAYRTDLAFYTNGRSVCLTELKGYQAAVGQPVIQPRRPNSRLDKVRHMFSKIT